MNITEFQTGKGLVADGIVGPKTAEALATAIRVDTAYLRVRLSDALELRELIVSATASRKGIPNLPDASQVLSLARLCRYILQPVRDHFGKPVVVTSGLRVPRLNRAIGGSRSSQHCFGEAADFTVSGVSNLEVCRWIRDNCPFDQLIYEFGEHGWIHCSYGKRHRRECTTATKNRFGRTVYSAGF